ncbi:hypothetical protein EJ04DRAFT_559841 [Polyplosphaeria fusca]|uniref:Uncharacterized protein n=1 Tax=Polyplosphaeria fusca TaxID=682080 RepID=A0A9P4R977_9PLEO|nr:hypothetical protein EJ04DRAFT_559841 [Polyplosphaeria fusca]
MDRKDSGFDQSYRLKAAEADSHSVHRSNTTATCRPKSRRDSPQSMSCPSTTPMDARRPASEKCSRRQRRPTHPRKPSIGSSDDGSTTRLRNRGHTSNSSSRRTSITIIDPSRPARHYRISSSQTVPTVNRDIDDVLALHFRSCSLFQNPSIHTRRFDDALDHGVDGARNMTAVSPSSLPAPPSDRARHMDATATPTTILPTQSDETVATSEVATTVTHWISPCTRRREYEQIDKQNSGIRGIVRRIIPRCVSGPPPPKFYEKDTSDTGSVRRYRMDLEDDEKDEHTNISEKSIPSLPTQSRRVTRRPAEPVLRKKWWGCF